MKHKPFLATAIAAVTLLGCSKPDIVPNIPSQDEPVDKPVVEVTQPVELPISFSTSLVHATKSPVTTIDVLQAPGAGFGVSAVYAKDTLWNDIKVKAPVFMNNQQILWDGSKWDYTPPKLWPTLKEEKITFFAYAPYNAPGITLCDAESVSADPSVLHFSLAGKSDETIDFVAACVVDGVGTVEKPQVVLELKPELTRIEMYMKVDEELYRNEGAERKTRVIVKSAKFTGNKFYGEADYLYNTADPSGIGTWDFSNSTATEYPIEINGEDWRLETPTPYVVENALILTTQDTEYQLLKESAPEEGYIFILPPDSDKGLVSGDIAVVFDYDIVTEDSNLASGYSCTSTTRTINLTEGTLKQGHSYKFTFHINMEGIVVSSTVVPSGNEDNK